MGREKLDPPLDKIKVSALCQVSRWLFPATPPSARPERRRGRRREGEERRNSRRLRVNMNEHQQHPCRPPGRPAVTPSVLIYHCPPRRRFSPVVFSKRSESTQSKPGLFNTVAAINNISPSTFVNVTLLPLLSYTRGICLVSSHVGTFARLHVLVLPAEAKSRNFI